MSVIKDTSENFRLGGNWLDTKAWIERDHLTGQIEYRLNERNTGVAFRIVAHDELQLVERIRKTFFPFLNEVEMDDLVRERKPLQSHDVPVRNDQLENWDEF